MNDESYKIAKKIEKLKLELSMLPPITERHSKLEIEEYQHYLLELEELLIVFKYLKEKKDIPTIPVETSEKVPVPSELKSVEAQNEIEEVVEEKTVVIDSVPEEEEELLEETSEAKPVDVVIDEPKEETSSSELENVEDNSDESTFSEAVETGASVNDQLEASDNSLASKLSKQPIGDLRTAFGLNERFLFANELFGGDGQEFIRALNEFNHLDNFDDAKRLIKARYETNFGWKADDENVLAFVGVVERRYL